MSTEPKFTVVLDGDAHQLRDEDIRNTLCGHYVGIRTWNLGTDDVTCDQCLSLARVRPTMSQSLRKALERHRVAIIGFDDEDRPDEAGPTWALTCSCSNFTQPVDFNHHLIAVLTDTPALRGVS